jgi:hypothetical protein
MLPVKLFKDYTIAIDCYQGVELFCGFYKTKLYTSIASEELLKRTYKKINKTLFNQPFLYSGLNLNNWNIMKEVDNSEQYLEDPEQFYTESLYRWDIANHEQDLKLFIKVPKNCKSSIVILEGDYRYYNDVKYSISSEAGSWLYERNHTKLNFAKKTAEGELLDLNANNTKLISKLQLLEFNTGESYPFSDRLVEFLVGSAITPIEDIPDNIRRAQKVMNENNHYFKIEGLWENKIQKIIYDYIINSGPFKEEPIITENGKTTFKVKNKRLGYQRSLGNNSKSTLFDITGYIDKDAEKWYANWKISDKNKAIAQDTISNVDIYDGLYDL